MLQLGLDVGTASLKLVLLEDNVIKATWEKTHHGKMTATLAEGLKALSLPAETFTSVGLTGEGATIFQTHLAGAAHLEEIPAIVEGTRFLAPSAKSIIEIGSQGSRFIAHADSIPQFATNGHCAGGTGSFFEDQMSRLGLTMEDFSPLVEKATSIPRLSGRCAVFAKTDIIHRQQEGASTPDILLGLCYAMIKNYKAVIVGTLPIEKPIAFCGGVTKNTGVKRAIKDVFALSDEELIVPAQASFVSAIGAALHAEGSFQLCDLLPSDKMTIASAVASGTHSPLRESALETMQDPAVEGIPQSGHCALGIDIGSTSTDLVLLGENGELLDYQYLRTAGNPKEAVQKGLDSIKERFGELNFLAVGVTGSGRERIGKMICADAIRDEITAQAAGAAKCVPDVDTVFEIGGQDSKYISLKSGEVVDFQMNKICAAGTGSFVEEQAARMGIPIASFGDIALSGDAPANLGERCTVFIETAIAAAAADGISEENIAAGLCYSIVLNYLHKVVGTKPVGERIVLQGGVAYNPGIVAAFRAFYGDKLTVNPYFSISGAVGVALLAMEANRGKESTFAGFTISGQEMLLDKTSAEVRENIAFYHNAEKLLLAGYTGEINPKKKTVGVPFCLMIHKFFPMANAFFTSLGFNVILTDPTNEETIRLSQEYARGETCYPVKLIYGHMKQLVDMGVDYIFLPTIHTMKHEKSHVEHNYGCVYMQTAAVSVAKALDIESHGIKLLSPVFDLDFGKEAMAGAMLGLGKILGIPKPFCAKALLAGSGAVRKHTAAVEEQGKILLEGLKPEDKVLVLITRNYGVSDPILNMGIPDMLLARGHKVITLSHLPGHSLDISEEYPNLYWPFGQHILSGAKLIAHHPNLYAVYLTNHGCGPDSMLSHLFRKEMGDKPYLQIEVDEHFSKVGVVTRVEAFLNSLSKREAVTISSNFRIEDVAITKSTLQTKPEKSLPLALPDLGTFTPYLKAYCEAQGINAFALPPNSEESIALGRTYTNSKEYLPFAALLGNIKKYQDTLKKDAIQPQYLLWQTLGSEADGQYAYVTESILRREHEIRLVAPMLERLPETVSDFDLFVRALLATDLQEFDAKCKQSANPAGDVEDENAKCGLVTNSDNAVTSSPNASAEIPTWETLERWAAQIGQRPSVGKRIGVIGEPLCIESLDDGILSSLQKDGYTLLRAPLTEYFYFLWKENENDEKKMNFLEEKMRRIGALLGSKNSFATDSSLLFEKADEVLPNFAGGNGRYRIAKAFDLAVKTDAILSLSPRYENTEMILKMRGLEENCSVPLFSIALDHDWDESASSKLQSFLYYIKLKTASLDAR